MPKFYATFGVGQPLDGYVLPLIAKDEYQARAYMQEYFNSHYCTVYEEDRWLKNRRDFAKYGIPSEEELSTIDISEYTKD